MYVPLSSVSTYSSFGARLAQDVVLLIAELLTPFLVCFGYFFHF
jgi:hypothetical protein